MFSVWRDFGEGFEYEGMVDDVVAGQFDFALVYDRIPIEKDVDV